MLHRNFEVVSLLKPLTPLEQVRGERREGRGSRHVCSVCGGAYPLCGGKAAPQL